jgi:hypothetical protein
VASVGVKIAVIDAVSTAFGTQVQVARPLLLATEEQPERAEPDFLNATFPGVLTAAEIVTGVPYFAVDDDAGSERLTVGFAFEIVIVMFAVAVPPAESLAVIV